LRRLHRHRQQPQRAQPALTATDHGFAALLGDRPGAERHLRAAAEGYRAAGRRRELAAVVLLLADRLDQWGRPGDALDLLRDGLHQVERLGERVAVLRATG
ncbi:hypothetical protein ABT346_29985, partial [Micromonospora peucetia]|uniref:hypothetical protein n=1 Tax=Micromonospora peucetia TaxID=47871 RepID=UPI003326F212